MDTAARIVALATELARAVPETCDRVALGDLSRAVSQVRSFCDALDVRIARRADELAVTGVSEAGEAVVAMSTRWPVPAAGSTIVPASHSMRVPASCWMTPDS